MVVEEKLVTLVGTVIICKVLLDESIFMYLQMLLVNGFELDVSRFRSPSV